MDVRAIRTIYAADLSTHKTLGIPYVPLPNTTLNQKFNVYPEEVPMQGEYPNVVYLAVGRGGSKLSVSTMGEPKPVPIPHTPEHAALYRHMPWIVRRLDDDLTAAQRKRYRMRVPFTGQDGSPYIGYYLKAIDLTMVRPSVELRHVEDGKVTATVFEPDVANLSPKPVVLDNVNVQNPNNDCLVSIAKLEVTLDVTDISELINAFTVIDGDASGAIINELALVSGVDRVMQTNINGAMGSYIEAIAAQINLFTHKYNVLDVTSSKLKFTFDVGSAELMIL